MFYALIYRQHRHITRTAETASIEDLLHRSHGTGPAITYADDAIHKIRSRELNHFLGQSGARVIEQVFCFVTK